MISIEHEWQSKGENPQTYYDEIYKVKIFEITLRELLILQSFYICATQTEIVNLVRKQPNPTFFYKSFLELDCSNMVTILAFDSGSMEHLLNDNNQEYYNPLYPVIYKTKTAKKNNRKAYYYNTAIDNALKNNQVKAVNLMIDYISKYQNSYVASYLFRHNLPTIMEKGIENTKLICDESMIFKIPFDFDDWPGIHTDDETLIRPYNDSYYNVKFHYKSCFPEEEYDSIDGKDIGDSAVYKIKYSINMLPSIAEYIQEHENDDGSKEYLCENEEVRRNISVRELS